MASKRGQKRRQCGRKQAFDLEVSAVKKANRLRAAHPGETFDAYKCTVCGKFHVGHRPRKVKQAITARREKQ
jgi:hypothetical protein